MKLVKTDKTYKYYELGERDKEQAMYYDYDYIAIDKDFLKYSTPKECLLDGFIKGCEDTLEIVDE